VLAASEDEPTVNVAEGKIARIAAEGDAPKAPAASEDDDMAEDHDDGVDRVRFSADVEKLIAEEREETRQAAPFGKTVRKEEEPATPAVQELPHEKRPETYVVQEGDTLFKLAIRFYGRRSAWSLIRDANKTTVSPDGRIRVGQKLRFP